jgi:hypothetical protein
LHSAVDRLVAQDDDLKSFTRVRDGFYARRADADIAQVLRCAAWKGGQYTLDWGVSLSYVPHKLDTKLAFHRTLKSARLDLWEDARSLAEREGGDWRDPYIDMIHGERRLHRQLARVWGWAQPRAVAWWARAADLEGVLAVARNEVERRPLVIDEIKWPRPQLVVVLTLARLGRVREAKELLPLLAGEVGERKSVEAAIERVAPASSA